MRTEREKWQVPESDPAGQVPDPNIGHGSLNLPSAGSGDTPVQSAERAPLIYCGQCGGLNPATNYFCAACGATLVDAFHAAEGMRVYDRPDTASRLIDIIPAGAELGLVDDPDAPPDFVRVKLQHGRLGYIRVSDIEAVAGMTQTEIDPLGTPDVNTNARGCITQTGALLALVLLLMLTVLAIVYISQTTVEEQGIVALAACVSLGPLVLITIAVYVYARSRDERLEAEAEEDRLRREAVRAHAAGREGGHDGN
ncbi:MAG: hypothetical protein M3Y37_06135 [Chloroflexota bacterium]|nr:hypothetical protein [Chloroflexota bacterium]